jgi:hypothetical protein
LTCLVLCYYCRCLGCIHCRSHRLGNLQQACLSPVAAGFAAFFAFTKDVSGYIAHNHVQSARNSTSKQSPWSTFSPTLYDDGRSVLLFRHTYTVPRSSASCKNVLCHTIICLCMCFILGFIFCCYFQKSPLGALPQLVGTLPHSLQCRLPELFPYR